MVETTERNIAPKLQCSDHRCRRGSLDLTECPSVEVPGTGQKEHSNPTKRNGLIPSTSRHTRAKARASVPAAAPRRRTAKAKEEPDWNPTGNAAHANPAAHTRRGSSSTGDKPDATADLSTSAGVVTVRPQRNTGRARRRRAPAQAQVPDRLRPRHQSSRRRDHTAPTTARPTCNRGKEPQEPRHRPWCGTHTLSLAREELEWGKSVGASMSLMFL